MGKCINEVKVLGNVGQTPEIAIMPSGGKVANFRVATSHVYTDRNNQKHEDTEWHSITAYGRMAEIVEEYVDRGSRIFVSRGRLKTRSWIPADDPASQKRYRTEIVVEDLVLLDGPTGRRYVADDQSPDYEGSS